MRLEVSLTVPDLTECSTDFCWGLAEASVGQIQDKGMRLFKARYIDIVLVYFQPQTNIMDLVCLALC